MSRRCASSFSSYSAASPAPMRLAIMLSRPSCTSESAMNRRAASSNSIVSARISVVRETRETMETTTMPRMNKAEIASPSGFSITLSTSA